MARSILLVSALALCAQAWPQLPTEDDDFGARIALPVPAIDFASPGEIKGRQFPVEDKLDMTMAMTLPVPVGKQAGRRVAARGFPVEDDISETTITLPVAIPQKQGLSARGFPVEDEIGPGSITLPVPVTPPPSARSRSVAGRHPLPVSEGASGAMLTLPVIHTRKPGLTRRGLEVELSARFDVAYYAQLLIGTPPQPVFLHLDTGSFETWVNPDCTVLAPSDQRFCEGVGFYDSSKSSTFVPLNTVKSLRYGIGAANVTYVKDSIALPGSATMRQVQFGVATETQDQWSGILGIGYGMNITTRYPNFLDELYGQGVTRSKTFSLALGTKDEGEGMLTFGGVDTGKFGGPLVKVPIIPAAQSPDGIARYWVAMRNMSLTTPSGNKRVFNNSSLPIFLDSGATLTLLPAGLADAIAADFGVSGVDASGFYPVACSLYNLNGTMDFAFDGITIKVPYREMIRQIGTTPPTCYLGIARNEAFTLLGDTFLRSTYTVFDLENNVTYMAQYQNCGSNPVSVVSAAGLGTLSGICGIQRASTVPVPASPSSPSPNGTPDLEQAGPNIVSASMATKMSHSGSGLALLVAVVFTLVGLL